MLYYRKMRITAFLSAVFFLALSIPVRAESRPGDTLPTVVLSGDGGGRTDGTPWSSASCRGRLTSVFYIDPDERALNEPAFDSLKAACFPGDRFFSVAILNMAATWMPDAVIETMLRKKQKKFPRTVYVRDLEKALVRTWGLKDQSSNILILDREGRVIFSRDGKLSETDIRKMMAAIREKL